MATLSLAIASGPPEIDLSLSQYRHQSVFFTVRKIFEHSDELKLALRVAGVHCEVEGQTYIVWGTVAEYSAGHGITVHRGKYFMARYLFSRQRSGVMTIFDAPGRMPWDENFPCDIDTSIGYSNVLRVSCLCHGLSVVSDAHFIEPEAGVKMSVNFRLLAPTQVLKKSADNSGMIWYSEKYRPATKIEHLFFNIRYPEMRQFFKVLCLSAVNFPNGASAYLYTCTENKMGKLSLIELGAEFADKDNWMVVAVPV